jgi:hypothetical protein
MKGGRRFKLQTKPGSMMELCSLVWLGKVGVTQKIIKICL